MKPSTLIRWTLTLLVTLAALAADNDTAQVAPALQGYDLVAYFTDHQATKGKEAQAYVWDDGRYLFASSRHREMFTAAPERYLPQFNGYCAAGISKGKKFVADPTLWTIVDGKLYVFSSDKFKSLSPKELSALIEQAKQNFATGQVK